MDSEISFAIFLIWALVIQVLILGLLGLVLLHRRYRQASGSHLHAKVVGTSHMGSMEF
ncbi:MAG: hypothetical protein ISS68_06655 [Desulfobacteraceae bacterium]|nr:hypothetical protein [Desulfobacteraceae bacterium]